jgi:hypothetical protein
MTAELLYPETLARIADLLDDAATELVAHSEWDENEGTTDALDHLDEVRTWLADLTALLSPTTPKE